MKRIAILLDVPESQDFYRILEFIVNNPTPTPILVHDLTQQIEAASKEDYHMVYELLSFLQQFQMHFVDGGYNVVLIPDDLSQIGEVKGASSMPLT